MKQHLITHPETGETLCKKQWAEKLGITKGIFSKRLQNHPLEIALTPGRLRPNTSLWSDEEDSYLCAIYRSPSLYRRWNRIAKYRNWKPRSRYALDHRITLLQHQGFIEGRRHLNEDEGWLTIDQLAECLRISYDPVKRWLGRGLKFSRNGVHYKIHLKDFVAWACTPDGAAMVGKAASGDAIASTWLLVQIGFWLPQKEVRSIE
jgi:excisionase family DNA binding protein